jgi:large subunit ribosomal protein L5
MARLRDYYHTEIVPRLARELGRTNPHALPQLKKIVLSMGVGKAIQDRKILEEAAGHLGLISGQKPTICRAKKSVSQFKLRQGMEIGCRVTLRQQRMYEFLDRLIALVLPRVRDFRGLRTDAFDGRGNYNLGLNEQLVFPEVNPDQVKSVQGLNITIVTSTNSDDEARVLLREFGFPFQRDVA